MRRIDSLDRRALRVDLCNRFGGACAYCFRQVGMKGTVDHYVPEALGGSSALSNLRWACYACNQAKGSMSPEEWAQWQPILRPAVRSRVSVRLQLLQLVAQRQRALLTCQAPQPSTNTPQFDWRKVPA